MSLKNTTAPTPLSGKYRKISFQCLLAQTGLSQRTQRRFAGTHTWDEEKQNLERTGLDFLTSCLRSR